MNRFNVQAVQADVSYGARMSAQQHQQESPVNFIWDEPVHAENLRGAQI